MLSQHSDIAPDGPFKWRKLFPPHHGRKKPNLQPGTSNNAALSSVFIACSLYQYVAVFWTIFNANIWFCVSLYLYMLQHSSVSFICMRVCEQQSVCDRLSRLQLLSHVNTVCVVFVFA